MYLTSISGKLLRMTRYLLFLALVVAVVATQKARFVGYEVHRVVPRTHEQVVLLKALENNPDGLSFWTNVGKENMAVDVMVPPHKVPEFKEFCVTYHISNQVYIQDVQQLIEHERPVAKSARFGWTNYYRLDEVYDWLDSLVAQYPGVVTSIVGGSSYEGRQIKGVKVSFKDGNPGVFVESGIHAREWIAPATVTYILNQLLTSQDTAVRDIAENYDWYIFPSVNPDGYEYTHTTNRMWRKTRSPGVCRGADPNRNWGFHWMDGGASSNPCLETYAGSKAFSEIETKSLSEYITSISDKIDVYLAFHSYSQLLLIPYGHTNAPISNFDTHMTIGRKAINSLASRYGTKYTVGNIVDTIYVASGGSMDWVRGTHDTPITYTYELRDTGRYGFILPANQIIPTGEETLDSVVTILQEAKKVISK